jgi:S-adenosylmethionine:tRNA ribosyltransferase-isomerase
VNTADFDFYLPPELVAQTPIEPRDSGRLLVLNQATSSLGHRRFSELPTLLRPGDLLVLNDTRVFPARLRGRKPTGGEVSTLLLRRLAGREWLALLQPALRVGQIVRFTAEVSAEVTAIGEDGDRRLRFDRSDAEVDRLIQEIGQMPTPPYIKAMLAKPDRYQTIYSREDGSVAAPTAGLHFTESLVRDVRTHGIELAYLTLHVGLGTFRPVKVEDVTQHNMYPESFQIPEATALRINRARDQGRRIVAVGTTTVRALESAADREGRVSPAQGVATLFIIPGYRLRCVDARVTNYHVPRSTLLMLVSALAGRERILATYEEAKARGYRFFSFGDAMLIT